jgi:hypothetical protein
MVDREQIAEDKKKERKIKIEVLGRSIVTLCQEKDISTMTILTTVYCNSESLYLSVFSPD